MKEFIPTNRPITYAEIGVMEGQTALAVCNKLAAGSVVYLFDFHERLFVLKDRFEQVAQAREIKVEFLGNSRTILDSYCWQLMKLLEANRAPLFDYVYLDGAHTWAIDGFAFMLTNLLLKNEGFIELDDYPWKVPDNETMRAWFTPEQMATAQVAKIVEVLVKPDDNYREVVENRIYQKHERDPTASLMKYIGELEAERELKPDKYELANQRQLVINLQKVTQKLKLKIATLHADLGGRIQQLEAEKADLVDALTQEVEENTTVRDAVNTHGINAPEDLGEYVETEPDKRPKQKAELRDRADKQTGDKRFDELMQQQPEPEPPKKKKKG